MTALGGVGIAASVDHLVPDEVRALADTIRAEHGHLDVLVNDIRGAEVLMGGPADWNTPIWEHDIDVGLRILRLAIDTHLITSHFLLPQLIDWPRDCSSRSPTTPTTATPRTTGSLTARRHRRASPGPRRRGSAAAASPRWRPTPNAPAGATVR